VRLLADIEAHHTQMLAMMRRFSLQSQSNGGQCEADLQINLFEEY